MPIVTGRAEDDEELWRVLDRMWMLFHQGRPEAAFGRDERDWMVLGFTSPTDPLNDIGDLDGADAAREWIVLIYPVAPRAA